MIYTSTNYNLLMYLIDRKLKITVEVPNLSEILKLGPSKKGNNVYNNNIIIKQKATKAIIYKSNLSASLIGRNKSAATLNQLRELLASLQGCGLRGKFRNIGMYYNISFRMYYDREIFYKRIPELVQLIRSIDGTLYHTDKNFLLSLDKIKDCVDNSSRAARVFSAWLRIQYRACRRNILKLKINQE